MGIGNHVAGNEPMDTIFVKNVRENSPASEAGLTTGDRIISVNGEDIAGLPYAKIIQLIHKAENYLHLLVVPKENDLLQLVSIILLSKRYNSCLIFSFTCSSCLKLKFFRTFLRSKPEFQNFPKSYILPLQSLKSQTEA